MVARILRLGDRIGLCSQQRFSLCCRGKLCVKQRSQRFTVDRQGNQPIIGKPGRNAVPVGGHHGKAAYPFDHLGIGCVKQVGAVFVDPNAVGIYIIIGISADMVTLIDDVDKIAGLCQLARIDRTCKTGPDNKNSLTLSHQAALPNSL